MEKTNTPDIEAEALGCMLLTQLLTAVCGVLAILYASEHAGLWGVVPLLALFATKLWWDYRLWSLTR